jgi:Tol biopolymer transport system component
MTRGVVVASLLGAACAFPASSLAAFPGGNGQIAYTHEVGETSASIYAVSPSGGTPRNLSAAGSGTTMNADFQPAWSATGSQLAFVRVDFPNCSGQIWTMSADGSHQTNVSNDATTANEFNPAYGPAGAIVFVRAAAGTFTICSQSGANAGNLWVRDPNGTTRQLTTDGHDNTPAWSPDGTKIAFTRVGAGGPHIFVMNADGSGTPTDLGAGVKPNWSPDGKRIVFAAPGGNNGPVGGPVTVMSADGSDRKTLNTDGTAPAFSPDGTKITYVTLDQATHSTVIGVMNADGSGQHNITSPGSGNSDVKPDWQAVIRHLRLTVAPRRSHAGVRTCYVFHTSSSGHAVAGASITFAHHRLRTSAAGRARLCLKLPAGRYAARATKPGYTAAVAHVLVRRRPHVRVRFTG